ncbi:MAG: membrane protein insertase YidC [Pseudomonadales bacterium]
MLKDIDWVKSALLLGMGICILILFREWDEFKQARNSLEAQVSEAGTTANAASSAPVSELPAASGSPEDNSLPEVQATDAQSPAAISTPATSRNLIQVTTDVLELQIDPHGGDLVSTKLLEHVHSGNDDSPYQLLINSNNRTYVARSGLIGNNGTDTQQGRPLFSSSASSYSLMENQDQLSVDLNYQQGDVLITKRFTFHREDYLIDIEYLIDNQSDSNWSAAFYGQINRDDYIPDIDSMFGAAPYVGAAVTTPEERYKKVEFEDIADVRYRESVDTGWIALLERYFLSAWIPVEGQQVSYDLRKSPTRDLYYIGFTQPEFSVASGQQGSIKAGFYVGPKDQYRLRDIAQHLDLTVDYGWLWWAAQPLYAVLYFIQSGEVHSFNLDLQLFPGFTNWGVSIILLTLIVKLILFPLSAASYKSMARMRKLTPKMTALRERYGDDRQAMSQEMMKLYQKEKVNPMGGCLPMLLQMPIFIALYWVLLESVEIRHAPFFGWIQDLSAKDPWFVLPLIMGASMWFQQKLNPPPPDPTQAKVMQMMPIMFTFMFMWFPSGLVLYWTVNNLLSITQQWIITRQIEKGNVK